MICRTRSKRSIRARVASISGRRFYSTELGRWLNRDPIEERGGRNLSCFISNAPSAAVDVLGHFLYPVVPAEIPLEFYRDLFRVLNAAHGEHLVILRRAYRELCPATRYFSFAGEQVTPAECRSQASELARRTANVVRDKLRAYVLDHAGLPMGYDFGRWAAWVENYVELVRPRQREMAAVQCGDWQAELAASASGFLDSKGRCSAFGLQLVNARKDSPRRTHQWVEVWGPRSGVVLDPWSSGGRNVIGNVRGWQITGRTPDRLPTVVPTAGGSE